MTLLTVYKTVHIQTEQKNLGKSSCKIKTELQRSFSLRGVISKIRAKWGMVIIADTADPNSALCNQMTI